jgi:hypothetical protein
MGFNQVHISRGHDVVVNIYFDGAQGGLSVEGGSGNPTGLSRLGLDLTTAVLRSDTVAGGSNIGRHLKRFANFFTE